MRIWILVSSVIPALFFLTSCGGGSSSSSNNSPDPGSLMRTVTAVAGVNGTIMPQSVSVSEGDTTSFTISPSMGFGINTVTGCDGTLVGSTFTTGPITIDCEVSVTFFAGGSTPLSTITYIKASNTDPDDQFGNSVSLNEDGTVLVVGADLERSTTGSQADNSRTTGAVYVFTQGSQGWSQQAYLKPAVVPPAINSTTPLLLDFGDSVSVDDSGTTIAAAATNEALAPGGRGGVYIFDLVDDVWTEQELIKITNADGFASNAGDQQPNIALDGSGNTLIVGEYADSSATTTIDGDETDTSAPVAGAAHVFIRDVDGINWLREAYLKSPTVTAGHFFGSSVAISGDGNTVAIGSVEESVPDPGSVYVFTRTDGVWSEQQRIQPPGQNSLRFGSSVSLSQNGNTLAIGATADIAAGTGVNPDPSTCCFANSGAAFVFVRTLDVWSEQVYLKASNADANDRFGRNVSLSSSGDHLLVGAASEASAATGINGDQFNNELFRAGAAYQFRRTNGQWEQQSYIKATNTEISEEFGDSLSISGTGSVLAIGSIQEGSSATGINGDDADNSAFGSGAVYVYQ